MSDDGFHDLNHGMFGVVKGEGLLGHGGIGKGDRSRYRREDRGKLTELLLSRFEDGFILSSVGVHHRDNARDRKIWIHLILDLAHGVEEKVCSFVGFEMGLEGDENVGRGDEAKDAQDAKSGGAIDQDVVIAIGDAIEDASEFPFTGDRGLELNFSSAKGNICREEIELMEVLDDREGKVFEEGVGDRMFEIVGFESHEGGKGRLGIHINKKHTMIGFCKVIPKIHGEGAFADPTRLVEECDDFGHQGFRI